MRHAMAALLLLPAFAACGGADETEAAELDPVLRAAAYPVAYLAERVAGDVLAVECPVPEDAHPITWQPSRDDLAAFQRATLIVINGANFEQWPATASLPTSRLVDTSRPFEKRLLTYETLTHSHGGGGEHTHEGIDGHTWLDPLQAKAQAGAIRDALQRARPDSAAEIEANFAALAVDLDALDARLRALGEPQLVCSHPAYNYLARRYGWEVTNFDLDPDAPLSEDDLARLAAARDASGARVVLWESEPLPETVARLTELSLRCVLFSPAEVQSAAQRAAGVDYLAIMQANVQRLADAL
jgi:zinc transport system substrate-binding protein